MSSTTKARSLTWYDRLLLLSPQLWYGFFLQLISNPFNPLRLDQLWHSLLGLLLPVLALSMANIDYRLILPLSPWTFAAIQGGIPPLLQIVSTVGFWKAARNNPLQCALDCLDERVANGRCVRCGRFDVFLPPSDEEPSNNAMLFVPGALIAHTAYSEIAAKISDRGICVVVVSMEPTRMAQQHLGADVGRFRSIQKQVQRRFLDSHNTKWSIAGHSLGSFAAMRMALPLKASSLVMWASANFPNTRTDLSESSIPTLVIQGSKDNLCQMDATGMKEFRADFRLHYTDFKIINGAAHSWFASTKAGDPGFTGTATISMEEQQRQAVRLTADFVLKKKQS